jgi:peptidoglycan/LPS O-acetylase OafA/YrhL
MEGRGTVQHGQLALSLRDISFKYWNSLFLCTFVVFLFSVGSFSQQNMFTLLLIGLFILSLSKTTGATGLIFGNRGMVYLGKISYSIYLVHYPVGIFLYKGFPDSYSFLAREDGQLAVWMLFLFSVACVIAVASMGYHFIENPARRWIKKRYS